MNLGFFDKIESFVLVDKTVSTISSGKSTLDFGNSNTPKKLHKMIRILSKPLTIKLEF